MAKNKRKNSKKSNDYEIGYGKPPKEFQWKKGCKSPNPKGRPKKSTSIMEAIKINIGKEISVRNENGEIEKISCADAIARRTLKDAIAKDGPTRRLLLSKDFLHLEAQEPIIEYDTLNDEKLAKMLEIEKEYGKTLLEWIKIPKKTRDLFIGLFSECLRDIANQKVREGE